MLTMGNREDLLAGARRYLFEKGYTRTTVRDISNAAGGVSMAAIGYHFGSKAAQLNAALAEANREWGDELERTLSSAAEPNSTALQRFEANWTAVLDSIADHRGLWSATFDIIAQSGQDEATRAQLAGSLDEARRGARTTERATRVLLRDEPGCGVVDGARRAGLPDERVDREARRVGISRVVRPARRGRVVEAAEATAAVIERAYAPMAIAGAEALGKRSLDELRLLTEAIEEVLAIQDQMTEQLRSGG